MRCIAILFALAAATELKVTPVQKVIQLLEGMKQKGEDEKHAEQVQFATYKQFCEDTSIEKTRAIKAANSEMEQLNAAITKNEADAATLSKQIAKLDEDISTWNGDKRTATEVREAAAADYAAQHKDYSESVSSLERAVATLSKSDVDHTQLLQLSAITRIPKETMNAITAFIAQHDEVGENLLGAPQANAYEFQSAGIVDMLDKLHDKFEDERTDLEKMESNAKHAYSMLVQDLTSSVDGATADREAKAEEKAAKLTKAAEAKGDLADTTATRDSDQVYLDDLVATCQKKSGDFENRQQLRSDELDAVQKAIEIMSSDDVSGNADKHLPAMMQATSFVQISVSTMTPGQTRVAAFLHQKGEELHSRLLSALALTAASDPFVKVRKMIKDLIVRLMEEANQEAEHKGYCDQELATNEQTRNEKTAAVETLHAEIDQLTASIAKAAQEITDLQTAIAELDAATAKATEIRQAESAKNAETVSDAQAAATATSQAVNVLKEFYEKAGDATSLIQEPADAPEVFDAPYKGMQSENGGVLGMLEVIASDFARLESETKAAEATAQDEHDQFMSESATNKAQNTADVEHKTNKKTSEESALTMKKEDLEGTQAELDAALGYYDKLKPDCVDSGVSFEDRVARRKEEVESLQEALKILNGEDLAFLQK